jgi:hypothetical protein
MPSPGGFVITELSTRELLTQLAELEDQVRCTPAYVRMEDGSSALNPEIAALALQELEILRALRLKRRLLTRA